MNYLVQAMSLRLKRTIWVAFVVLLIFHFLAHATDADKISQAEGYYQQALVSLEQGNTAQAVAQLKTALKFHPRFAQAHNQLAIIFMNEGTVDGRFRATIEIEQAIKLDPRNIEFRLNEAQLNLKKGFPGIAAKNFERILDLDPRNYAACFQLAKIKEAELLRYKDMISIDESSDVVLSMRSFAERANEQAIHYYQRAISIQPRCAEPYYRLALLYFESKNFDRMIELLESAVKIIPDDKNCHLFLGFAHQTVKNYQRAAQAYQQAKALMSPDELKLLEAVASILPPKQRQIYRALSSEEKERFQRAFWTSEDPFFLTEYNERQMEHFRRMAYANLRFSISDEKIEGWQTDQGRVLIRYGFPVSKYRTRPFIGSSSTMSMNPLHHSKEVWIYPGFEFVFEDRFLSDRFAFAWGLGPDDDYKIKFERLISKTPELYELIPETEKLDVLLDLVAFQGRDQRTDLELCFALPASQLRPAANQYKLQHGVFLFDENWNPVIQDRRELSFKPDEITEIAGKFWYGDRETVTVPPGNYHLAFEFEDERSGHRCQIRRHVKVDRFSSQRFQMSDLLFASKIKMPSPNGSHRRADFQIIPNPMRMYRPNEPLVIYYELYQLHQDSSGETRFRVEYRLGSHHDGSSVTSRILATLKIKRPLSQVTTSYEYAGNDRDERQYLTIALPSSLQGEMKLTLIATDLSTGESVQREGIFWITE